MESNRPAVWRVLHKGGNVEDPGDKLLMDSKGVSALTGFSVVRCTTGSASAGFRFDQIRIHTV